MSLNCNEIDLILTELDLAGAFVQDIVQPSFDSIALYTYKPGAPKTVFISLAANACRLHEVRRKIPKNEKPLRFMELLRSRIKGARVTSCAQIGKERVVKITLHKDAPIQVMPAAQEQLAKKHKTDTADDATDYALYIRLWSGAANIFLCDTDDVILDSFYRRPAKNELTGNRLMLPAPKPSDKTWEIRAFAEIEVQYAQDRRVKPDGDIPPSVAVTGMTSEQPLSGMTERVALPDVTESVALSDVTDGVALQGLTSDLSLSGVTRQSLTFNQKVDLFYSQTAATSSLESLLAQAEKWYAEHKSRQEGALERLREKRTAFLDADRLKHQGDLILAYGYAALNATANGNQSANFLECQDYDTGETVRIKIDPKKSAQENAAAYYEQYKKATSGLDDLEHDIARAEKALAALKAQYAAMQNEKNPLKLEQLLRKTQKPKQQEKKSHPGLDYVVDGWYLLVGRDATENDELLRHHVRGQDLWLHTRDYSGGYVFIKARAGKTVPLEILLYAGNLAVYYSKARKNGSADLYYTQVKHLRRAKNGPKGLVLPTHEKNLFVKLDTEKLRALEDMRQG